MSATGRVMGLLAWWALSTCLPAVATAGAPRPGSWVADAPAVTAAVAARRYHSTGLRPPNVAQVGGGEIVSLRWRFQLPAGRRLNAWLCRGDQAEDCTPLPESRGRLERWRGESARGPFFFRFETDGAPVTVSALQLIVNYR